MSNARCADMYRRGTMRDYEANTPKSPMHLISKAVFVPVRARTVPPVEDYAEWLATAMSADPRGKTKWTAAKLRRAVVMIRNGSYQGEVAKAVGISNVSVWLAKLPPELRP